MNSKKTFGFDDPQARKIINHVRWVEFKWSRIQAMPDHRHKGEMMNNFAHLYAELLPV